MLASGPHGVTLFGTTGEGASVGLDERAAAVRAMLDAGVPAERMTLGTCGSAVADVAAQVRQGVALGVTRYLLLPPF